MKKTLLIITLLTSLAVTSNAVDSKAIWEKDCMKCHGVDGKGETKMGQKIGIKNMTDPKVVSEMTETNMVKIIKEGVKDKEDKTKMKAYPDLTDDEVKSLVTLIKDFKK
jgi:cytochrome c551/c552